MAVLSRQREPLPFGKRRPLLPPGSLLAVGGAVLIGTAILVAHSASLRISPSEVIGAAFATDLK
jgi:hypothetical protein